MIDGGVTNKVPVDVLASMGTDFNIAVNVSPEIDPSFYNPQKKKQNGLKGLRKKLLSRNTQEMYMEPNLFQITSRWYSTSSTKITEAHLHLANVVMRPHTEGIGMLEWAKFDEAIVLGEVCAQQHADEMIAKYAALCGR